MPTIKNPLLSLSSEEIANLLKETENRYRLDKGGHDNAAELYDQVMRYPRADILSDDFLELVYETLKAFNMNVKGAKLSRPLSFKESLKKHGDIILSLSKCNLEQVDGNLKKTIGTLFDELELVRTKAPLVTFSKTMHFLLPDLFMPIDRKYTIQYFYRHPPYKRANYGLHYLTDTRKKQKERLFEVFEQFRLILHKHREVLKEESNSRWNRNIPKVIDNIIIAYVKKHME